MSTLTRLSRRPQVLAPRIVGAACGLLCAILASHLGLGVIFFLAPLQSAPMLLLVGGLLGANGGRWILPAGVAALLALTVAVDFTAWPGRAVSGLVVQDKLVPSEVIVVLAADILPDGTPTPQSQHRTDHALELLRSRYAPRLILTRFTSPRPSYAPHVRAAMKRMHLQGEISEVGPIRITSDEARAVSILARAHHWKRIILVTDRAHTWRARALFRQAGLDVLCSPCQNPRYNARYLRHAAERRMAFQDWLYETVWFHAHFSLRLI